MGRFSSISLPHSLALRVSVGWGVLVSVGGSLCHEDAAGFEVGGVGEPVGGSS